MTMKACTVTA